VSAQVRNQPFWRRRLLWPCLALLALNAAVGSVYTLPQTLREQRASVRATALREELARKRAQLAVLERRADILHRNAEDTRRFFDKVLGTRPERLVPLLREIEKTAEGLGLGTGRAGYQASEVKQSPLVRFVITMPISGSYRQLLSFLDRLERSTQFLIVEQVALREKQGAGADLSVVLSTYFRSETGGARGR
jgi:Tfp pilus assembly protein PilO